MQSKFKPNFEGEDFGKLIDAISRGKAKAREPPDTRDRIIVRAPLAPLMVHMTDERALEKDDVRPGKDVTMNLGNVFAHLSAAAEVLGQMHRVLGQVHTDIRPENLLLHYGKDGEVVYVLNDFDSGYTGRLNPTFYGEKAKAKGPSESSDETAFEHYTYEDLRKHLETAGTS